MDAGDRDIGQTAIGNRTLSGPARTRKAISGCRRAPPVRPWRERGAGTRSGRWRHDVRGYPSAAAGDLPPAEAIADRARPPTREALLSAGRHHPDRPRAPVEATSMGGGRPGLLAAAVPDICQGSRFSLPPTNASRVAGVSCLLRQGRPPGMAGGADGNRSRLRNSVALGPRSAYGCAARRFTNGLPA